MLYTMVGGYPLFIETNAEKTKELVTGLDGGSLCCVGDGRLIAYQSKRRKWS